VTEKTPSLHSFTSKRDLASEFRSKLNERRKRLLLILGSAALLSLAFASAGMAGKPQPTPALSLTYDALQVQNSNAPPWCLSEDASHERRWSGRLSGTFTTTEYFCQWYVDSYNGYDYWNGGGVGLLLSADVVGNPTRLSLSSANGLSADAVLTGTSTTGMRKKAVTTYHYVACAFAGGQNFPGMGPWSGTWTATVAGSFSSVTLALTAEMYGFATVGLPTRCPSGQLPPTAW
jgi:hypothetical protein